MKPINFKESNGILGKPKGMTDEECKPLNVWTDGVDCITCWRPSPKERLKILLGQPIWVAMRSGSTQPPMYIKISKSLFN